MNISLLQLPCTARRWLVATLMVLPLLGTGSLTQAAAVDPAPGSPTAAVKSAVDNILGVLRKPDFNFDRDRATISADLRQAFDDVAMAQSVLSTNWKSLNPAQQKEFTELLAKTVENTYIGRMKDYTNESVEFRKEEAKPTLASVDTVIVTSSKEIPIKYRLRKRSDGWFIYDVDVENASLVNTYRDTYRSIISKDGVDGLLKQMKDKLAELEK